MPSLNTYTGVTLHRVREEKGVFLLLFKLCHHNVCFLLFDISFFFFLLRFEHRPFWSMLQRCGLDVVRMLMQKTQNRERMRGAFMEYANQGKLTQFAALFLAAPEVFFSSVTRLYHELNSLEKRPDIQEELCLLHDDFDKGGDKLVAYIRLEEISMCTTFLRPHVFSLCNVISLLFLRRMNVTHLD